MKLLLFILIQPFVWLSIDKTNPLNHFQTKEDKIEDLILNKVGYLKEVKLFFKTYAKDKPVLLLADKPNKDLKYYWVKLGISNMDMFRTSENFCVNPKTYEVYYWDIDADDLGFSHSAIITLEQWRYWRLTPGWNKRHTWKSGKLVALAK